MEEQSSLNLKSYLPTLALLVLTIIGVIAIISGGVYYLRHSDPYIREVIAIEGDPARGNAIFQMNCSGCHGTWADGKVGPSLKHVAKHRSQWRLIHQITSGQTPPMPKFQASPSDMADLLSYLNSL